MIKLFAKAITFFLIQDNIISDDEAEIYQYGTEQILINLITFSVVGIVGTFIDMQVETSFFFLGLVPIRMIAGGYHAKTPKRCNRLTFMVYIGNMVLIRMIRSHVTYALIIMLCAIAVMMIFYFAPVDHKNRILNGSELIKVKRYSRFFGFALCGFIIGLSLLLGEKNIVSLSTMMGVITASVSLYMGSLVRGGERSEEIKCST